MVDKKPFLGVDFRVALVASVFVVAGKLFNLEKMREAFVNAAAFYVLLVKVSLN